MVRQYAKWRVEELNRRGWRCEARIADRCDHKASQLHHILSRSQGGALMEAENVMGVCLYCHTWIEHHPREAKAKGWKRSPWKGRFPNE